MVNLRLARNYAIATSDASENLLRVLHSRLAYAAEMLLGIWPNVVLFAD